MKKIKSEIPIFFSADDNYVPCLAVAIKSLIMNSSKENNYRIIVLNSGITKKSMGELEELETENVKISFQDISHITEKLGDDLALRLRDYYSTTIYYRMFIPSMFPEYEKAIYIDSDIVLQDDIANFYNTNIKNNLLGAVTDAVITTTPEFIEYTEIALGIDSNHYFNSGVLLMNLREMRKAKVEDRFITMLVNYNLDTVAPDQDYLNVLCQGRVYYFDDTWNKMPDFGKRYPIEKLHLIHYNMYRKPWHYVDVPYSEAFWKYAKETKYYDVLQKALADYTDKQKENDKKAAGKMIEYTNMINTQDVKFVDIIDEINENANDEGDTAIGDIETSSQLV